MIITPPPGDTHVEVEHHICEHHRIYPDDVSYAGCGCSSRYALMYDKNENEEKESNGLKTE